MLWAHGEQQQIFNLFLFLQLLHQSARWYVKWTLSPMWGISPSLYLPTHSLTKDSHNTGNFMPSCFTYDMTIGFKWLSPQQALPHWQFFALVYDTFCCFWNLPHFSWCQNRQWFDQRRIPVQSSFWGQLGIEPILVPCLFFYLTRHPEVLTWDALVNTVTLVLLYLDNRNLMLTQYSMTNSVTFPC